MWKQHPSDVGVKKGEKWPNKWKFKLKSSKNWSQRKELFYLPLTKASLTLRSPMTASSKTILLSLGLTSRCSKYSLWTNPTSLSLSASGSDPSKGSGVFTIALNIETKVKFWYVLQYVVYQRREGKYVVCIKSSPHSMQWSWYNNLIIKKMWVTELNLIGQQGVVFWKYIHYRRYIEHCNLTLEPALRRSPPSCRQTRRPGRLRASRWSYQYRRKKAFFRNNWGFFLEIFQNFILWLTGDFLFWSEIYCRRDWAIIFCWLKWLLWIITICKVNKMRKWIFKQMNISL